jgi:hypothetical protein
MEEIPKVYQPKFSNTNESDAQQETGKIDAQVDLNNESESYDASNLGKEIAENMDELGYHPVVIFGSSFSGKSSLLGSLLAYFQVDTSKEVGISLGEPLVPSYSSHGKQAMAFAEAFYYRSVQEFIGGQAHAATKITFPFFIPIIIRPKGKDEMKFAFMESVGEWYKPQKNSDRFFQALKFEVDGILRHYQKSISFIHIAPFTQSNIRDGEISQDHERSEINDASLAIVGALDSYNKIRTFKSYDNHMFLVTKWDAYTDQGLELIDVLANPDLNKVEEFATEKYTQGLAAFKGLPLSSSQKSIMQYCSGMISGRAIIKPSKELTPILYRYPQTMWNWLYKNASGGAVLLPKPPPIKETFFQIIMKWINKIVS